MKSFVTSLFLVMTLALVSPADAPVPPTPPETRLFELREYHAAPGRIKALHDRFRGHTVQLLEKHGITSVAFFVAADGSDDVLRVILAYPDAAARKRSWESFVLDPEWQRARRESDARGRLVEKIREYPLAPAPDCPRVVTAPAADGWLYELRMDTGPRHPSDRADDVKVLGSWTTPDPRNSHDVTQVRLIARRIPSRTATRDTFFRGPLEPTASVRRTAAEAVEPPDRGTRSLVVVPTDYSPIK